MSSSSSSASIEDIFKTMEYGPAPEDDAAMTAWLKSHEHHMGLFIDGEWVHGGKDPRGVEGRDIAKSYAPSTGDQLAFFTQGTNRTRIAPSKRREKLKSSGPD